MSDISDWDAVPVKASASKAQASSSSNTSDWDTVPVKAISSQQVATPITGSAGAQQKQRIMANADQMRKDIVGGNVAAPGIGILEGVGNIVSGMGSSIVGGLAGGARTLYNLAAGEGIDKSTDLGAQTVRAVQDAGTYQPRTAGGKLASELASAPINAVKAMSSSIGGDVGQVVNGQQGRIAGEAIGDVAPDIAGAVIGGRVALARPAPVLRPMPELPATPVVSNVPAYIRKTQVDFQNTKAAGRPAVNPVTPAGTTQTVPVAEAAQTATPTAVQAPAPTAPVPTPQIASAIQKAGQAVDPLAAARHTEASSLPVPMELTKGQASGDVNQLSKEQNMRGANPQIAQRFNAQNGQLIENVNTIRESASPDVTAVNHVENGQALIDSYKAKDAALSKDISAKYKALEEANGGQFPVDGKAFVEEADRALSKKMKGRYVPPEIKADMDTFRNGEQMTFENFENMRTNLAADARKAESHGDGNRAYAISIVRDALESLPITGESAAIKPLADIARSAAKARFDLISKDPAYKAAINDSTAADDFINKFVINGKVDHVKTMRTNLANDPLSGQTIAAGTVNYLKSRAGLVGDTGNFSQAGYNKALRAVSPKLDQLFQPEHAQQLQTLGNVARYTQEQPRGSYVNNSNTFVAGAANLAKGTAEGAANVAAHGIPVGTWVRKGLEKRAEAKAVKEALAPGAGIKLSDFPK